MRIAICDDEEICLRQIEAEIEYHMTKMKLEYKVCAYTDSASFLRSFTGEQESTFDLILLDIEMEPMNGIEVAKQLRKYGYAGVIVFITSSPGYAIEGYQVQAYRYIVKPFQREDIESCLIFARKEQQKMQKSIILNQPSGSVRIREEELIYLEMYGHMMRLHLNGQTPDNLLELRASMSSVETQCSDRFTRIHKSFLINLDHVKQFQSSEVLMDNGDRLSVSRHYAREFRQRITGFWGEKING